jgi:hypothetical protein
MAVNDTNLVSDEFWLNLGAEQVYNTLQARKDSIDRLQKTIVWVFGIYSSITFVSVLFAKGQDWKPAVLLLFGISFLFLILAYWVASFASFSLPASFYASAAESVKSAFNKAVNRNSWAFNIAVILSGIGTIFYALALLCQFSSSFMDRINKDKTNITHTDTFQIQYKIVDRQGMIANFLLSSKKNTLHRVFFIHDTIAKKRNRNDTLPINCTGREKCGWVYTDSTNSARFSLKIPDFKKGLYLLVIRSDSANDGKQVQTHILKYALN